MRSECFKLCCCFSFLFWREIGFGFTYYLCTQSTIQLWCCVSFFGSGGKQFLVRTYLVYNTVVRLCQFFNCGGKANLVRIFLLNLRICFSYFLHCMDLQPYSHDCFSKISRTLFDFLNNTNWFSLFQSNNLLIFRTGVSCFSVALFVSTLVVHTNRRND